MSDKSRNLVHLRWLLKLIDFRGASELSWGSTVLTTLYREMCWATQPGKIKIGGCILQLQSWNHGPSHVGLPTELQDIWLLLDQRSEVEFEWTPYEDPVIQEVIPEEFLVNPNIWYMKPNENWLVFHSKHINMWNNWIHGKPYLYGEEARRRHPHTSRPRRPSLNSRASETSPSSVPTQKLASTVAEPMPTPPTGWSVIHLSPMYYTFMPSTPSTMMMLTTMYRLSMFQAPTESPLIIPSVYGTQHSYAHSPFVRQTPLGSLFYQVGLSSQPSIPRPDDAQWQPRMHGSQLTKGKKRSYRDHNPNDHNPAQRLNQEGIQSATIDHPDVAQILTDI
ncbi:hypothetical protein Goari_025484 [Gossypium aridum]|uniref:Aminotransferase-like plant mobile domain-containing protein n=1 Tax=Gossypium aridum TaxID=34290 RepID=A0A7J8X983_GOSAI|nr:hypothetical protein [Gossypium aridum]